MAKEDDVIKALLVAVERQTEAIAAQTKAFESYAAATLASRGVSMPVERTPEQIARRQAAIPPRYKILSPSGWRPDRRSPIYGPGETAAFPTTFAVTQALAKGLIAKAS